MIPISKKDIDLAQNKLAYIKELLGVLLENQDAKLLRVKPMIGVLDNACNFMIANLDVISKIVTEP